MDESSDVDVDVAVDVHGDIWLKERRLWRRACAVRCSQRASAEEVEVGLAMDQCARTRYWIRVLMMDSRGPENNERWFRKR